MKKLLFSIITLCSLAPLNITALKYEVNVTLYADSGIVMRTITGIKEISEKTITTTVTLPERKNTVNNYRISVLKDITSGKLYFKTFKEIIFGRFVTLDPNNINIKDFTSKIPTKPVTISPSSCEFFDLDDDSDSDSEELENMRLLNQNTNSNSKDNTIDIFLEPISKKKDITYTTDEKFTLIAKELVKLINKIEKQEYAKLVADNKKTSSDLTKKITIITKKELNIEQDKQERIEYIQNKENQEIIKQKIFTVKLFNNKKIKGLKTLFV